MLLNTNAKRLLIYLFSDKKGIIDSYIPHLLTDMRKNVSDILFVSNGTIVEESLSKLQGLVDNILQRENSGYDVWAYKDALEYIGWNRLSTEYDEVILMNDTIMGPIYPFKEMFDSMSKTDVDFWGITYYHGKAPFFDYLQSYFIVYRKSLLMSDALKEYWDKMPQIKSNNDAAIQHEMRFTAYFEKLGYRHQAYVDTQDQKDLNSNLIRYIPTDLIKKKRCPIFLYRCIFENYGLYLSESFGNAFSQLMQFLKDETDYNTDMIWEAVLRRYDMNTIMNGLHLNCSLSNEATEKTIQEQTYKKRKVALFFHAYYIDLAEDTFRYINAMPQDADIYITTDTEEKKQTFERLFQNSVFHGFKVLLIENRGRDVSSLLVAAKPFVMDYDYVCFSHDKKSAVSPKTIGQGFSYLCQESILGSNGLVQNIIQLFDDNPRLGLLTAPPPIHGLYFGTLKRTIDPANSKWVKTLYDQMHLQCPMPKDEMPIAPLGTMFWFRPQGMKSLFDMNWKYEDFPPEPNDNDGTLLHGIERIYSLVEHDAGFYTAYSFPDRTASVYITNMNYMLRDCSTILYGIACPFRVHSWLHKKILLRTISNIGKVKQTRLWIALRKKNKAVRK